LIAQRDPNCAPTKISGPDFQQEFARFRFNEVSATIDNDRSILRLVGHSARHAANARNTVVALARPAIIRHRLARQVSRLVPSGWRDGVIVVAEQMRGREPLLDRPVAR
jgi:hypothetical protein